MKKINHITLSFAISLWIFYYILSKNIYQTLIFSFLVGIFASLPDIDIKIINKSWNITKNTLFLFYPIHIIIKTIFKHRTITHSIWIAIILLLIINFIENNYLINILMIIILAIILHILEDSFTISGIKPLYPIPIKLRFAKFSTNSKIDFFLFEFIAYFFIFLFFIFLIF